MSDLAAGKTHEQRWLLGNGAPRFDNVVAIVEADTDDLSGIGNDGGEGDLVQWMIGRRGHGELCRLGNAIGFEQLPQIGAACHACAEIDDAIIPDGSEGGMSVGDE
ncbi:hypothetical protein ACVWWK_004823 [Bradyrhizobium sp. LB9.1b]